MGHHTNSVEPNTDGAMDVPNLWVNCQMAQYGTLNHIEAVVTLLTRNADVTQPNNQKNSNE